jgi:hypothetical protein
MSTANELRNDIEWRFNELVKIGEHLREFLPRVEAELRRIDQDSDLTDEGRRSRRERHISWARGQAAPMRERAEALQETIEKRLRKELEEGAASGDRLTEELAANRALAAMSGGAKLDVVLTAAKEAKDLPLLRGLARALPMHVAGSKLPQGTVERLVGSVVDAMEPLLPSSERLAREMGRELHGHTQEISDRGRLLDAVLRGANRAEIATLRMTLGHSERTPARAGS